MQRCVAVSQVTLSTGIKTRTGVFSSSRGIIQQRTWTSTTRTVCLQRLCQLQSAVKTSRYSLCTKTGAPGEDEYPPLPTYQLESESETEVYIVKVKGLLWSCSAEDLLQFFSECRIRDGEKGIHFTETRSGRPSGIAFIEMEHEEDVRKALEKHRQYLGPRYVEVYEVTNREAEAILKKAIQPPRDDGVVRLRGLPFVCTEADIAQFFSGLDIVENGITIITDHIGRNTGKAFVQFYSQKAADEALLRDREVIGNRYIEVFPSSSDEIHLRRRTKSSASAQIGLQSANRSTASQTIPRTRFDQSSILSLHFVRMRGIPFQTSAEEIVKFFSPLVVSKILIDCCANGRPSGEANIYFNSHQDAMAAMSKDKQYIGERYIELFLNSEPEPDGR